MQLKALDESKKRTYACSVRCSRQCTFTQLQCPITDLDSFPIISLRLRADILIVRSVVITQIRYYVFEHSASESTKLGLCSISFQSVVIVKRISE